MNAHALWRWVNEIDLLVSGLPSVIRNIQWTSNSMKLTVETWILNDNREAIFVVCIIWFWYLNYHINVEPWPGATVSSNVQDRWEEWVKCLFCHCRFAWKCRYFKFRSRHFLRFLVSAPSTRCKRFSDISSGPLSMRIFSEYPRFTAISSKARTTLCAEIIISISIDKTSRLKSSVTLKVRKRRPHVSASCIINRPALIECCRSCKRCQVVQQQVLFILSIKNPVLAENKSGVHACGFRRSPAYELHEKLLTSEAEIALSRFNEYQDHWFIVAYAVDN